VWTLALQQLPPFHQAQPESAVSGIACGGGMAAAFIGAALKFVMTPGSDGSEPERNVFDGGMFERGVEHTGSFAVMSVFWC
jgi:hypothetical protein